MTLFEICYHDGTKMKVGDGVTVTPQRRARVSAMFYPGTKIADDFSCPEGGFMLEFEDGDVHVWANTNEDIELRTAGGTGKK